MFRPKFGHTIDHDTPDFTATYTFWIKWIVWELDGFSSFFIQIVTGPIISRNNGAVVCFSYISSLREI